MASETGRVNIGRDKPERFVVRTRAVPPEEGITVCFERYRKVDYLLYAAKRPVKSNGHGTVSSKIKKID